MKKTLEERFWSKVDVRGPDECWPWTAGCGSWGYGQISVDGKMRGAHCVSFELANGPVPPGLQVLHTCDNPPCCNPKHLFAGTTQRNMQDKVSKGRQTTGESHPDAKLTVEIVAKIRARYNPYNKTDGQRALAREFGVRHYAISRIVRGDTWKK